MLRDTKWMVWLFQGVVFCLIAFPAWGADSPETKSTTVINVISPSHTLNESKPLRFGDPETMIQREKEEEEEQKAAKPAIPVQVLEPPTEVSVSNPRERIREIIASVPKGSEYPAELEKIVAIGRVGVPTLIAIFEDASSPWQSRWIAGMAMGRLGTLPARQALEKGLADPLFLVRMASIQALSRQGDLTVATQLRKALSDRALVVRSTAVESLERMKDRDSLPDLIKELSASRNFHRGRSLWIREQIVGVLGAFGGLEVIPPLLAVLHESELSLRLSACQALAQVSPEATPALLKPNDEVCVAQWVKWGSELPPSEGTESLNTDDSGEIVDLVDQP